jgi:hypothetical protein
VIENHEVGCIAGDCRGKLCHLSGPDERGGLRSFARLDQPVDDFGAGAGRQFRQFVEGFLGVNRAPAGGFAPALPLQAYKNGAFAARTSDRRV